MKLLKAVPLLILLFIVGIFGWALFLPKEDVSRRIYQTIKEQEKRADLAFKKVQFEEVSAGEKFWQLNSQTAIVNKNTGIATLQETDGTFYKRGRPVLRFRSPAAMWDMKKKEIFLDKPLGYDVSLERQVQSLAKGRKTGRASVFSLPRTYKKGAGYWFQANNLSWRLADEQLLCTGGIVLSKGEATGNAEQLQSDVGLENIRLTGQPWLAIATADQPITLEADSFEVIGRQDLFIAQGAPKAAWGEAEIRSETANYFQGKNKVDFNGTVKVRFKDITAAGDLAEYLIKEQKVILSGNAQAQQGDNKLSGQKIIVSLKDQKVSLVGKSTVVISAEELK